MTVLDVYLEAVREPIGQLSSEPGGDMSFRYVTDAIPHAISASLPIREEPFGDVVVRGFFSNLLFENEMRDQVMQRHGIAERDIVGLLTHIGADCPGAISCVPDGAPPGKRPGCLDIDYDVLDGATVVPEAAPANDFDITPLPVEGMMVRLMESLRDRRRLPADIVDPSPLAGVQGKVALAVLPDGRMGLPKPGRVRQQRMSSRFHAGAAWPPSPANTWPPGSWRACKDIRSRERAFWVTDCCKGC